MSTAEEPFFTSVQEFVEFSQGNHAIQKILIANNGIGATKAIKSIRRWSFETFGDQKMIKFVVMATPEDMKANAEYIRMADQVVDVPGGSNNNNYANINLICQIADRLKVDAVMPMWGHASENPALPTSLLALKRRVTFIGPAAEPMQALGDKIGSTIIAQSAGVPTIAWNGDNLTVNYQQDRIPQSVYDAANVCTAEDALACAERIGYPVMIKASEGGGGKGIRKVHRSEDVINLYRQVQAEIPGSPIFVMKMASTARHLEVQLLADQYGEAIALSGRDCSVQRRHQKIIEEGPPIAASPSVFKMMERAAVALAKTVGYANAGTVEYLFMEKTNEFAFLELNPRLQVEHPVTENILGLNLPACQLQVAMGIPLHRIADVRKLYGRHPRGRDTIDFEYSERTVQPRHCIAVRVTAENPEAGFQPTSGNIEELQFSSAIDVWGYFSVNNSGMIHEFADSQFGHVFASGKDRESARRAMVVALKQLQIRGDIRTTIEYIIRMMQSDDFINNRIDTDWLDGRIASHKLISMQETGKFCPPPKLIATCGAALQGYQHLLQRDDEFVKMLRVGQVPPKDTLTPTMDVDLIFENVKYKTKVTQSGPQEVIVQCNGSYQQVAVRKLADGGYLLSVDGKSYVAYSREESGGSLRMILDGNTCMFTPEYDPTKLVSAVAGKLARQLIPNGSHVNAGDPFVEIEVMKMYMPLKALEAGIVTFQMSEGAALSPGDVIATCQLDNPDSVVTAEEFQGSLPLEDVSVSMDCSDHDMNSSAVSDPAHVRLREAVASIMKVLDGYPTSNEEVQEMISTFIACNADENLPLLLVEEAMAVLRGRIDSDLAVKISELNDNYRQSLGSNSTQKYPSAKILALIVGFSQSTTPDKRAAFAALTSDLRTIVETFVYQTEEIVLSSMVKFIEKYIDTEKLFDSMSFTDVVNELRKDFASDLNQVLHHCRSHVNVECKNILILRVLEEIKAYPISQSKKRPELPPGIVLKTENHSRKLKVKLGELAKLAQPVYSHISFAANLLMMDQFSVSLENRRQKFTEAVIAALATGEALGEGERVDHLNKFIDSNLVARDLLIDALHNDHDYQLAVMELYLRKIYQKTHELKSMMSGRTLEPTGVPPPGEDTDFSSWIVYKFITKPVEAIPQNDSIINVGRNVSFTDLLALSRHGVSEAEGGPSAIASGKPFAEEVPPQNRQVGDRTGVLGVIASFDDLQRLFPVALEKVPLDPGNQPANAMHIALLRDPGEHLSDDEISAMVTTYLASQQLELQKRCIRRVSFIVPRSQPMPTIFTYRYSMGYIEDVLFRYIEAPLAFHLDLHRLAKFNISLVDGVQSSTGNIHLYRAYPKDKKGGRRFFARLVSFTSDVRSSDMESLFVEALDQLALVKGREDSEDPLYKKNTSSNHIFINIVSPDTVMKPDVYDGILKKIANKYWYKMLRLAATTVELKLSCRLAPDADPLFIRLVATNPTGFVLKVDKYFEALVDGKTIFKSISRSNKGPWDGLETHFPYEVTANFEEQRANAMAASDTLYVYDWPMLFETATEAQWTEYNKEKHLSEAEIEFNLPNQFFSCKELVLYDNKTKEPFSKGWTAAEAEERGVLVPSDREPGKNDVGMVAWIMNISTPEAPQGRDIVVICNDITHQAGSFGTKEDIVFFKASEYARERGLPRLFLAANSGARIGMAQSLKSKFQVCWNDASDPAKGFQYIYLDTDAYEQLLQKYNNDEKALPVICNPTVSDDGQTRYVITDIIGEETDLGVENLMGSGLIAGETSRAYNEIFTLTIVVGRTVGIGAYLVRLGQRTIQKMTQSPIILTGYQALNKLMGREIYTTNDQLGGPMIMYPNGVSHLLSATHYESVSKALQWLSFVPSCKGGSLPIRNIDGIDSITRTVDFAPTKGVQYDPRMLLCGVDLGDDCWQSGFLDRNSFIETLAGWAKTVVAGRGRIGGVPIGVIVTENRTAETTKPADPADLTSQEKLVQQAGGVWFPDSAYKTAQALKDFNRENLPCIIFANWRGFSGGQRDMFDEVLKFGSMIVDALVAYQQPLFVYIPPFAELRGGAWVVVDSTINSDVMEFYAAEDARGGVLEATGAASIKFRAKDIVATAHRIDHVLTSMDKELAQAQAEGNVEKVSSIQKDMKKRERMLTGVYQQVAVHFADLHDTPGRMKAKGVIRQQVNWANSRTYFYWRLLRRLKEFDLVNQIMRNDTSATSDTPSLAAPQTAPGIRKITFNKFQKFIEAKVTSYSPEWWENDEAVLQWYGENESVVSEYVAQQKSTGIATDISRNLSEILSVASAESAQGLLQSALSSLTPEQKQLMLNALK